MHILVTGANGQLGSELRQLTAFYPMSSYTFVDIDNLDITSKSHLESFFGSHHFDIIINCAAYTAVDKAESEFEKANQVNHLAVKNLAMFAKMQGSKLIHISTDYVFDGKHYKPYEPHETTNPLGAYGKTKYLGETVLFETMTSGAMIIRTSWLYSSYGNNFLKTMLRLGSEKECLNVVADQIGSPTHAKDLARAILDICHSPFPQQNKIYHYSNEGVCSWYDFAVAIMSIANLSCIVHPIPSNEYPTPTERPFYSVLSKASIQKDFENICIPYWRESLNECIQIIQEKQHAFA